MTEEIKQPRNTDLIPMTFIVEKITYLEGFMMVHKDMLTETKYELSDIHQIVKRGWNYQRADIPKVVRVTIIYHAEADECYDMDYSDDITEVVEDCRGSGSAIDYILTKDGLVPLEFLPDLKDEDLSWRKEQFHAKN